MSSAACKVLLIGLDSAEPELLERWAADGTMPVLRRLRDSGFLARTRVPRGMGNGALWPSVFTGVNPGRHGRYFRNPVVPGSYEPGHFDPDRGFLARPFWEALSDAGRRVGILDMVVAPLSPSLHGFQIADWTTHDAVGPPRSTPAELIREVTDRFGGDPLHGNGDVARDGAGYRLLRDQLVERVRAKTACALHYLARGPWDFFTVAYADPHDIGHQCWHLHDPSNPRHDAELVRAMGDPLRDVYVALDDAIGRLLDAVDGEATVLLFSGPGMGPPYSANHLLEEILRRLDAPRRTLETRALDLARRAYRLFVPAHIRERPSAAVTAVAQRAHHAEMQRRRFFSVVNQQNAGAIRLNVVGREPQGVVRRGAQFDAVCDELETELRALVNLDDGKPLVTDVIRMAREFHGPALDSMPDLLAVWRRDRPIERVGSPRIGELTGRRVTTIRTGDHTPNAELLAWGRGVRRGHAEAAIAAEDIAPTIAALLGVALPDSDGASIPAVAPTA